MDVEEVAARAVQRVAPYDGLAIDAATWTEAHAYHQVTQQLHMRLAHGHGIVAGLSVTASDPPGRSVVVGPGIAIGPDGTVIRVPAPVQVEVPQGQGETVCFLVRFAEQPVKTDASGPPSRIADSYELVQSPYPPPSTAIEVARLLIGNPRNPVRNAADEWLPGPGEIDLRFRRSLRVPEAGSLTVGHLALAHETRELPHRRGVINVVRDLRASAPFAVHYAGDVRAEDSAGRCDLLYISGAGEFQPTPREGAALQAFVRGGGAIFAEPCVDQEAAAKENGRFVASFRRLMADLSFNLEDLEGTHPLFTARHVFGTAPQGMGGHAALQGAGTVILNPNDYGCYWQGGTAAKPLMREPIRSAMEFAANIAWNAAATARTRG